jgi:hypothetical protein
MNKDLQITLDILSMLRFGEELYMLKRNKDIAKQKLSMLKFECKCRVIFTKVAVFDFLDNNKIPISTNLDLWSRSKINEVNEAISEEQIKPIKTTRYEQIVDEQLYIFETLFLADKDKEEIVLRELHKEEINSDSDKLITILNINEQWIEEIIKKYNKFYMSFEVLKEILVFLQTNCLLRNEKMEITYKQLSCFNPWTFADLELDTHEIGRICFSYVSGSLERMPGMPINVKFEDKQMLYETAMSEKLLMKLSILDYLSLTTVYSKRMRILRENLQKLNDKNNIKEIKAHGCKLNTWYFELEEQEVVRFIFLFQSTKEFFDSMKKEVLSNSKVETVFININYELLYMFKEWEPELEKVENELIVLLNHIICTKISNERQEEHWICKSVNYKFDESQKEIYPIKNGIICMNYMRICSDDSCEFLSNQ